jgi:hypothetical protein
MVDEGGRMNLSSKWLSEITFLPSCKVTRYPWAFGHYVSKKCWITTTILHILGHPSIMFLLPINIQEAFGCVGLGWFCGCLLLQVACVTMSKILYRTRVQFPHKLFDFQCLNFECFCFCTTNMWNLIYITCMNI